MIFRAFVFSGTVVLCGCTGVTRNPPLGAVLPEFSKDDLKTVDLETLPGFTAVNDGISADLGKVVGRRALRGVLFRQPGRPEPYGAILDRVDLPDIPPDGAVITYAKGFEITPDLSVVAEYRLAEGPDFNEHEIWTYALSGQTAAQDFNEHDLEQIIDAQGCQPTPAYSDFVAEEKANGFPGADGYTQVILLDNAEGQENVDLLDWRFVGNRTIATVWRMNLRANHPEREYTQHLGDVIVRLDLEIVLVPKVKMVSCRAVPYTKLPKTLKTPKLVVTGDPFLMANDTPVLAVTPTAPTVAGQLLISQKVTARGRVGTNPVFGGN